MREPEHHLPRVLHHLWWTLTLRGLAAIIFGMLVLAFRGMSWQALVYLFSAYALSNGFLALMPSCLPSKRQPGSNGSVLISGISMVAGLAGLIWAGMSIACVILLIAGWAIACGLCEMWLAIRLHDSLSSWWLMGSAGVLSILLGIALLLPVAEGAVALPWWIAGFSTVFGIALVLLSILAPKENRPTPIEANRL